jgi:hypothetical protein
MSYQIPQNLKYKEKIAFNLTFEQMAWLGGFGSTAAITYLKLALPFPLKELTAIILASLGVGFGFFGFAGHLKTFNQYRQGIVKAGYFDKKMGRLVDVKKVEKDTIFLKEGSLRAIMQVTPINFSMLSKDEQRAIIKAFKDFLNSLDFTVQIVVRTVNLSLEGYLQNLQQKAADSKNEKVMQQFESFRDFVNQFIEENAVKDRLFYLVVLASPQNNFNLFKAKENKEQALKQLAIRVKLCQQKLKKCNLLTKRLNTEELVSLLASFFHGFIEAGNGYLFPLTMIKRFEKENEARKWVDANGSEISTRNAAIN